MIKFSIIVPIYNIENYVNACMMSILNQSYQNFQVILVNDGSTDNSLSVINKYREDERIQIINKQNGGLSSARNAGLECVSGDYVMYVDGDDWLESNALQTLSERINKMEDVDMLMFAYNKTFESGDKEKVSYDFLEGKIVDGQTFFENSNYKVTAWSKAYKKQFLDSVNLIFLEGRLHEDISYTIPLLLKAERVSYIDTPLYNYRQDRVGSIMAKVKDRNVDDYTHALCFVNKYAKDNGCLTNYCKKYLINSYYHSCFTAQTSFEVLSRCMKRNNVPQIVKSLDGTNLFLFWMKLFLTHLNHRSRFLFSQYLFGK